MAKILLDACVPQWLRNELGKHDVETAHFAKLDQLPDSKLLDAIDGQYEILVTLDRNLSYQQKITDRQLCLIVLQITEQTPETFQKLIPEICKAIDKAASGSIIEITGL